MYQNQRIILLIIVLCWSMLNVSHGQQTSDNPFALIRSGKPNVTKNKIVSPSGPIKVAPKPTAPPPPVDTVKTMEKKQPITPVDTSAIALKLDNPFALQGERIKRKSKQTRITFNPNAGTGARNPEKRNRPIFTPPKVNHQSTLNFVGLAVMLILLAIVTSGFRSDVEMIYRSAMNNNILELLHREKGGQIYLPFLLLYGLFFIGAGMFIYLSGLAFGVEIHQNSTIALALCIGGVASFYLIKHSILNFLGWVFPFTKEIALYGFSISIFNFILGIFSVPLVMFLAFAPENIQAIIPYVGAGITLLLILLKIIRGFLIGSKYIVFHKFHFFIYLCTIEIAPLLIIAKLVTG